MKRLTILLLLISLLVACTPSGEPAASEQPAAPVAEGAGESALLPADTPQTTEEEVLLPPMIEEPVVEESAETAVEESGELSAPPETEPVELPENEETAVAPVEAPAEETGPMVISGRLDEGAFFLGDPNAPVTLIDYSDFL